ncbi:MAG: hypothetical protein EA355_15725 [Rhodobacteraceae bacterium]|nr:MAG: hypothetical protein EA355_15725 [Paracoccaceae bacterium]
MGWIVDFYEAMPPGARDAVAWFATVLGVGVVGVAAWFRKTLSAAAASAWHRLTAILDHQTHPVSDKHLRRRVFGREAQMAALDATLAAGRTAAVAPTAGVVGGAGVGKSTLARHFMQQRGGNYDRTAWFDAESAGTLMQQMADLPGLDLAAEGPLADRALRAKACIEGEGPKRWLVVFDNVEDLTLVDRFMPTGAHIHGIFTTRQTVAETPSRTPVVTPPLDPAEAVALLQAEAEREDPDAAALAEDLGRLPHALVQAGEWLSLNPGATFAAYREKLVDVIDEWPRIEGEPDDYYRPMGAAIALNLEEVAKDRRTGPDEQALLRLLPWLAPEGIDAKLVLDVADGQFASHPDYAPDIPADLRSLAADPARLHRALTRLGERALAAASPDEDGPNRTVALHRVTALVVRRRLARDAPALRRAAAAVVAAGYPGEAKHVQYSA